MGIPDHFTCLLRNLCVGQEATVRILHETTDWFKVGKGRHQCCILSPSLFHFYAEYIMWNIELDESQVGINIAWRNNNLRHADDTIPMVESDESLIILSVKSLLITVKEKSEKSWLKIPPYKTKIMVSGPITSWQIEGEKVEVVTDFIFFGSKITTESDYSHEIKRCLFLGGKAMTNLGSILKSWDITLPTKIHKALVFPGVMYICESWTREKVECQRLEVFKLWCWRRLLRIPWTARRSN